MANHVTGCEQLRPRLRQGVEDDVSALAGFSSSCATAGGAARVTMPRIQSADVV
ncbi:hypothetical protein OG612_42155 (plasmid) [Streptomyces sp. NBC_01527]|uniref:hypothetical protein n=1 Tax=unclassified Streptomyces TaxID=2593676 RepID=UPI002E0E5310|nr:hypothetical protein OG763_46060 [Streptomyces sp. NBC_01230]